MRIYTKIYHNIFSIIQDPTEFLDLSGQKLTSADTIIIGTLLAENPHIRRVDLRDNDFGGTEGENFIAYALERNPRLALVISNNYIVKKYGF